MISRTMKKLALIFLCIGNYSIAHESVRNKTLLAQFLGYCGQSHFTHACSQYIQAKIDQAMMVAIFNLGDELASYKYQELGKQAQDAVGIPLERQVPIKKINPASPMAYMVSALAEAGAIYVNEEKLDQAQFGSMRCALYHEAVHIKYNDKTMDLLIEICSGIGVFFTTLYALKYFEIAFWNKTMSLLLGLGVSSATSMQYHHFRERRADIEGHYATQCACCVREHAQRRYQLFEVEHHELKDQGYLWSHELERIAQDLGDQRCSYHLMI